MNLTDVCTHMKVPVAIQTHLNTSVPHSRQHTETQTTQFQPIPYLEMTNTE